MKLMATGFLALLFSSVVLAGNSLGLPTLAIPSDNAQTPAKIDLGKALFHDKRLSADGSVSCASCHREDRAFTDGLPQAKGINGQTGTRNTPTVINAAFYQSQFLDGRESSLEAQSLKPLVNPIEHGLKDYQSVLDVVRHDLGYIEQFKTAFAVQPNEIRTEHVAKAIASFERTLIAGDSPFDRYYFAKDQSALSDSAKRGSRVFRRKGNCMTCHEISWNNALFTDNRFYNVGVGFKRLDPVMKVFMSTVSQGGDPDTVVLTAIQRSELGRFTVTKALSDMGRFKTPSLRNIALTAPYMHDGSLKTLEEVVEYYNKGGDKNPYLDAKIFSLQLTEQEKADLVAFLKSLTSPQTELK